ncbi:efflux RND transporter periplasmic adaptor subunit [Thermosynechococcus sp. JY1334]|uniref:efflux RND transporter periplasmic adaptor subunit n=1 Tax=unclassified Thermosynechococcus TaxID=2622553 RepID=UPI0026728A23|nr:MULTISPECIES: efflux RND transporter periplasmic adaptor subunit [unclassified Thermosynechococcus]MDR7898901.1 efflux RND transporter periplasmic adaptor subunit [Thermosynechococcus sp. JY1332]MDR7906306.1 efflux RND transporter periplasmic adaptor subunit [Thermosynechococcus sp. JY1334]WKT86027.1 efflux RND transporter periplasmic adaptor subunit [Thermosynechococcus sp. JY1339]WNC54971.1 efflux RND transporter periplasmic adaptor subunit [Thermosynechococcus sp. JY1331]
MMAKQQWLGAIAIAVLLGGCQSAINRLESPAVARPESEGVTADVAVARLERLETGSTLTGTTRPYREVMVRSQVEGQVLHLSVDVGDRVQSGQLLAEVDPVVLKNAVFEAEAELAARRNEVIQAQATVNRARTAVEEARLTLQQAESDARRLETLLRDGAVSAQAAEQARTTAQTARQVLRSREAEVVTAQQGVAVAQGRVQAQIAFVQQARARLNQALLRSPLNGVVLERLTEVGNLLQPGGEVLRLGDIRQLKVVVEVSERELARLAPGQGATVTFDAVPNRTYEGRITRISPAAAAARLIPVEVVIDNADERLGSGLLARVAFQGANAPRLMIPQSALSGFEEGQLSSRQGSVFVVVGDRVQERQVTLGQRREGKVEILSGLNAGDRYVVRSGRPLRDGDKIRPSILSEG